MLTLRLRAIGAAGSWVSPAIQIANEQAAQLDIYTGMDGSLRRSMLMPAVLRVYKP